MARFDVIVKDEYVHFLEMLAETTKMTVEDLIQDIIDETFNEEAQVEIIIKLYKAGDLSAREAWKLSGLNYQDFQTRAGT